MAENKTQITEQPVMQFIQSVEHEGRRQDATKLLEIFSSVTDLPAVMWGSSIVGFGEYQYTLANGKTSHFMRTGFSPRKQNLALYIMTGFDSHQNLVKKLGKFKTGKSCLYLNKLADVNEEVLKQLIAADLEQMAKRYPN